MKSAILSLLFLLTIANVFASGDNGIPYHPYRKVIIDGQWRYYSLQPLYDYYHKLASRRRSDPPIDENRPLPDWNCALDGYGNSSFYQIISIQRDGILLQTRHIAGLRVIEPVGGVFFLKNYPRQQQVTDNQDIDFFALRVGSYKYEDTSGATHTVPCYDYGIPYDPFALAKSTQQRTNKPPVDKSP